MIKITGNITNNNTNKQETTLIILEKSKKEADKLVYEVLAPITVVTQP